MTAWEPSPVRPEFLPLSLARALWKRKVLVLLVWMLACAATVVTVYQLPAIYRAESLILIEGQRIPERYVPGTVADELDNRLSVLTQQVKSYDSLLELIEQFDLYRDEGGDLVEEEIIEKMRRDIQVELVKGWDRDESPAFRISYQGSQPQTVARVANEIRERFLRENLKIREEQAAGTSEFLGRQLQAARADLEKQEARLSEYKRRHNGELPEQASTLAAMLNRLQMQLQSLDESINQNRQNRLMLENSLALAESSATAFAGIADHVADGNEPAAMVPAPETSRVEELSARLASLRLRYSDDHPDVQRAASELERARQAEASTRAATVQTEETEESSPGPAALIASSPNSGLFLIETLRQQRERVEGLKTQLTVAQEGLQHLEISKTKLLEEISGVQARIHRLPLREQELAREIRGYDISRANYQSLLNKRMEADMAANMEAQQKAERFTVLDVARVPGKPIKPRRELLIAAGSAGSLVLAALFGFAVERRRNVLLGEWELPADVVVLGRVPHLRAATGASPHEDATPTARNKPLLVGRPVLVPTLLLCLLGVLIATSLYTGWDPF